MEIDLADLPDEIPLNRDASYNVAAACNFKVTRAAARAAINSCNGDLNLAMLRLLKMTEGTPIEELCEFGGVSRDVAENYLKRASSNVEVAKNLILQDILILGSASDGNATEVKCPCCLESFPFAQTLSLQLCDHVFCIPCLQEWIAAESSSSSTGVVRCPRAHECSGTLNQSELKLLLPADTYFKLDRRALETAVQSDPSLRMCRTPDCNYIVAWSSATTDGPPVLLCPLCHCQQCLACGATPFHVGMSCEEAAEKRILERKLIENPSSAEAEEEATRRFIESSGIRICKQCGSGVEQSSGCFKMKCRCGYRFCYKCGSENARCGCTPANHGFWDNTTDRGDFSNLR